MGEGSRNPGFRQVFIASLRMFFRRINKLQMICYKFVGIFLLPEMLMVILTSLCIIRKDFGLAVLCTLGILFYMNLLILIIYIAFLLNISMDFYHDFTHECDWNNSRILICCKLCNCCEGVFYKYFISTRFPKLHIMSL